MQATPGPCSPLQRASDKRGSAAGKPDTRPFLSWGSSFRPSTASRSTVHSKDTEVPLRTHAATREITFRPHGFSPPRRLAPVAAPGVLQPVTVLGFVPFPEPHPKAGEPAEACGTFPATRSHPSKNPSMAAAPHHCGRCPLVVTADPASQANLLTRARPRPPSEPGNAPAVTEATASARRLGRPRPSETGVVGSCRELDSRGCQLAKSPETEVSGSPVSLCSSRSPCAEAPAGANTADQGGPEKPYTSPETGWSHR